MSNVLRFVIVTGTALAMLFVGPALAKKDISTTDKPVSEDNILSEISAKSGKQSVGFVNIKDFGAIGNANYYYQGAWYADQDHTILANDDTAAIQAAIDSAKYGTHEDNRPLRIYSPRGKYLISGTLHVDADKGEGFQDIVFEGDGRASTVWCKSNSGYIVTVNMAFKPSSNANFTYRGIKFKDMKFSGAQGEKIAKGVRLAFCQNAVFENVHFTWLDKEVSLTNESHYPRFDNCMFTFSNYGIYNMETAEDGIPVGWSNNGIITNCNFQACSVSTISLGQGNSWNMIGGAFEQKNGTAYISNNNKLTGVRVEQNDDTKTWIQIDGNGNELDFDLFGVGGSPVWRVIVNGTANKVTCRLGYNLNSIYDVGGKNEFIVTAKTTTISFPQLLAIRKDSSIKLRTESTPYMEGNIKYRANDATPCNNYISKVTGYTSNNTTNTSPNGKIFDDVYGINHVLYRKLQYGSNYKKLWASGNSLPKGKLFLTFDFIQLKGNGDQPIIPSIVFGDLSTPASQYTASRDISVQPGIMYRIFALVDLQKDTPLNYSKDGLFLLGSVSVPANNSNPVSANDQLFYFGNFQISSALPPGDHYKEVLLAEPCTVINDGGITQIRDKSVDNIDTILTVQNDFEGSEGVNTLYFADNTEFSGKNGIRKYFDATTRTWKEQKAGSQ